MNTRLHSVLVGVLVMLAASAAHGAPLGTAFTYQGQLQQSGGPANGNCSFDFKLFDAPSGGSQIGLTPPTQILTVTNGLFTTNLDFGAAFDGNARWLEIAVACPPDTTTTLSPRQPLTPAPYALFAATTAQGAIGTSQLSDNAVTGAKIADGSVGSNDVNFNYAASTSKGGPAIDVSFPYAGSTTKGGPASSLACVSCVDATEVGFNFAASDSRGGPATDVSCNGCVNPVDLAVPLALSGTGAGPILAATTSSTSSGALAIFGEITTTAAGGSSAGVMGFNDGTGAAGFGVRGSHAGGGTGVFGSSVSGEGVQGSSTSGAGVLAFSDVGVALVARANTNNLIELYKTARPDDLRRFYVANSGNVFADGSYNCGLGSGCFNTGTGADVAERIDARESLHPGDLVEIDPLHSDRYRVAATAYSTLVAGVVSTNPGMTMNNNDLAENDTGVRSDTRPLLALVGKVPVKVSDEGGTIRPGDLLVASSTPGHAMKASSAPAVGTVVGKALEPLAGGTGVIKMLVMLR